jgi:magnesium transporter
MTIIASYIYRDGKRAEEIPLATERFATKATEFAWIGLAEPTAEEMAKLKSKFDLHPLSVDGALNGRQVPKVDVYGDQLFVVAKTAHLEGDKIAYRETGIFVSRHHVVTVRHGSARTHTELRNQREQSPQMLMNGPDYVLHAIIDCIVDGYLPIVEKMEGSVLALERHMLVSFLEREQIRRIFRMRRQVILFQRVLGPMTVVSKLTHLDLPCIDEQAKPYFCDVLDHVKRVEAMIAGLRSHHVRLRGEQPSRTATPGHDHPSACSVGGDPRRPEGDRRHLRHELRAHAGTRDPLRLLRPLCSCASRRPAGCNRKYLCCLFCAMRQCGSTPLNRWQIT